MADLLLERAGELAAIERAIRMARAGCSRRLLISGPPGSGRTTLMDRTRARARAEGLTVLSARGEERERRFAFALARRLLPSDASAATGYETSLELNRALARRAPVLVAVDDIEFCDAESLDWLAFAARRFGRVGVAIVLAGAATRFEDAVVLPLRPFSERAVAALLHVALGQVVDAAAARACHLATGGHPLLVCEVAAATANGRHGAEAVPPGVARFLQRRLRSLPRGARRLARAIALLGPAATLHEAATLAGLGPDHAAAAADRLRVAGLLVGEDALAIAPPLLARALYDDIPPARRALWHSRAARGAVRPARVIHHLLRSEPSADAWVAETLASAARRALERGRPDEAAALLRRADREGAGDRGALLTALAEAQRRLASDDEIEQLEAALEHGAPRAATTSALARALLTHGRAAEALALRDADPAELHAGARLIPGHGRSAAARLADASAREDPSPRASEGRALMACWAAEAACTAASAQTAVALATRALAGDALDPESPAYFSACAALTWSDELALARRHLDRALAHARRLGSLCGLARAEAGLATVALRAGELEAAVEHATTALGSGGETAVGFPARAVLALTMLELDRLDEAAALCDASTPELRYARGRLRIARHEAHGALDDLLEVGRELARDVIAGPALIPWRSAAALAQAPDAEELARCEHALATRFGAPRAIGRALRALATVGPVGERTDRCLAAVQVLAPSEARLEYAHALCDLGASLRRERARRAAREPLREALDLAVRCGAVALVRRAREELLASGARPRRLAQSGRDALTPAELRVALLAARGLANREIARTLVVTVKTVETELSHTYAKLGIRSRRELAGVLQPG
ncbi:LuxR C-terminal-related transcriptional regulator [Solirubrobacter ginsenosidimutans]|uniref:LuxR C-terminal-related transcriptional regulator n=1 Tax=Solirubrobacter ginsenosidimutans TaxID=490573 RepID=A0A9X3S3H5_9ACTN|nr:LuxR family transcriptional regulator [Solirubrobacter ginsenosidimutans]MDA0163457.1 LuxR C-terminal-related transcriptional regulator [Solirubrobacter ginsenosidimutans]